MVETKDVVLAIFGATSALSALVLVFLGLVAGALQSLGVVNPKVKLPYKIADQRAQDVVVDPGVEAGSNSRRVPYVS
jgi:hypothetical protein